MINKLQKIVIATGGTGGHIFPAYSLAKHFADKKIITEIISDKRGLKYLKNLKDIKINEIISSRLPKKNIFRLIFSLLIMFYSFIKSLIFLIKIKPDLIFGMGGYSSFPACLASKILRIPIIIYENNLHIGRANKYLLPFAKKILVSNIELEGVEKKYKKKICFVGNIIRKEILNFKRNKEISEDKTNLRILILGGSQAAKVFGEKMPEVFVKCQKNNMSIKIYQQCLPEQIDFLSSKYQGMNIDYSLFHFDSNILKYFSKVDLAITRSGSSVLAELINLNIPFVSVPLPKSADNHQLKNAIFYEKNQYSFLIEEINLKEKLFTILQKVYEDRSLLASMRRKQKQHSDKFVYDKIEEEIKKLIDEKY